jgi:hypothetical protein
MKSKYIIFFDQAYTLHRRSDMPLSQDNVIKLARRESFCDALTGVFRKAAEIRTEVNAPTVSMAEKPASGAE